MLRCTCCVGMHLAFTSDHASLTKIRLQHCHACWDTCFVSAHGAHEQNMVNIFCARSIVDERQSCGQKRAMASYACLPMSGERASTAWNPWACPGRACCAHPAQYCLGFSCVLAGCVNLSFFWMVARTSPITCASPFYLAFRFENAKSIAPPLLFIESIISVPQKVT